MSLRLCPKLLFFDLDGTLADSIPLLRRVYSRFIEQFGLVASDIEFDSLNGPPLKKVIRYLIKTHSLSWDEEKLVANYLDILKDEYAKVKLSAGAIELLNRAKNNNCHVGVVTSNTRKLTKDWLGIVNIDHMIDFIVTADDVKQGKPHPEPYMLALKFRSCKHSEAVAIEDSPQGATSAISAGINTLVLNNDTKGKWPNGVIFISSLSHAAKELW